MCEACEASIGDWPAQVGPQKARASWRPVRCHGQNPGDAESASDLGGGAQPVTFDQDVVLMPGSLTISNIAIENGSFLVDLHSGYLTQPWKITHLQMIYDDLIDLPIKKGDSPQLR